MQVMLRDIVAYIIIQSWQIAILALIVGLVTLSLRRRSAHVRYLLWLVVLAKCLVPPMFSVGIPALQKDVHVMPTEQVLPLPLSASTDLISKAPAVPAVLSEISDTPTVESARKHRYETINPMDLLSVLWLTGGAIYVLIVLGKACSIAIKLNKKIKPLLSEQTAYLKALCSTLDIKNPPKLWRVNEITQPFVWGFPRGSIYVPTDLWERHAQERLNCTLAHELSHVIRLDAFVNLLQILAQGIFWFHPLVWWVNCRLRVEREKCCDETAIVLLKTSSDQYGSAIVEVLAAKQQAMPLQSSMAIAGPTRRIEERLRTIMEPNKCFYKTPNTASIVFVLILSAMAVSTTFHMQSVEAAELIKLPHEESTAEPNSPDSVSSDEAIHVECVVYEVEASVLHDLVGKDSGVPTAPTVTMDQNLIVKITTSAKTSELVRWGDSPTVVRLGKAATFARTTVIPYLIKYTTNSTSSKKPKPLIKEALIGLEFQLTATRIQDSDMILISIETKSKKLHHGFLENAQGHGTQIPVIVGSIASAEVAAQFGQSILLSGLPLGGPPSHETSDRCLAFVITPQRRDVSHKDDQSLANGLSGKPVAPLDKRLVARPILAEGADIAFQPLPLQTSVPAPVSDSRRELDRILDAMRRHDTDVMPIAMHVDIDMYTFTDDGLRPDSIYRIEQRLDGRRLDSLMSVDHIKDGRVTHRSESRHVFTGEHFLSRRQQTYGDYQTHVRASLYSAQKVQQTLADYDQWGGVLLGHLPGDRRPVATILKEAANVSLGEEAEAVDGFVCRVIEGKTTHGNYKLWVDTQHGFRIRRASVDKGPEDLFLAKPIARQAPKDSWTTQSVHMEISSVTLQRVGSKFIPTAESLTTTTVATDGTTRRSRTAIKRSDIDLNPDFDRLGAFVMDGIPEETRLDISDSAIRGYGYQWKGGRVTPLAPGGAKIVGQIKFVGHENPATVLAARPLMNVRLMYARFEYRPDGEETKDEPQSNNVRLHLDDEGRFRIEDVPPGACTLTLTLKEIFMIKFSDGKEGPPIKSIASSDLELTIPESDLSGGDHSIDLGVIEMAIER